MPAQVKMSISCKNLAVSQTVGSHPPDPCAALYVADSRGHWEQVSRTETAQNTRGMAHSPCVSVQISTMSVNATQKRCSWGKKHV